MIMAGNGWRGEPEGGPGLSSLRVSEVLGLSPRRWNFLPVPDPAPPGSSRVKQPPYSRTRERPARSVIAAHCASGFLPPAV